MSLTKKTKHSKNDFGAQSNRFNLLIKHAIYTHPFRELELVTKSNVLFQSLNTHWFGEVFERLVSP